MRVAPYLIKKTKRSLKKHRSLIQLKKANKTQRLRHLNTVYVFAPMAIAACMSLGLNPTAAAAAIVISGWNGHFLPIDGMPAMVMGIGKYKLIEFWKYTIPMYFIRLLALTAGALLLFPM